MGKEYEVGIETTVPADPEQVWEAITTSAGVSSWYIGRTQVDGSMVRTAFGEIEFPPSTVTAAEPPGHFAYRTETAPDGRFQAFEFLVEGRDRSATVLRVATSGFLPGDDWADEYEAMSHGLELFYATLIEYLGHFAGRSGSSVTAFGPPIGDWSAAWEKLTSALGLSASPKPGDTTGDGGEVFHVSPHTLAFHTEEGLFRYIRGFHGAMVAAHVIFPPAEAGTARWEAFLNSLYAR
ncbi:SRPBCC domain-containing protein [Actinoplanes sp. LDG1-06]|uniref:SRPBCC domain-containing protein n=1 Tax=Paractinoplanes ovalisporus TaxID=2810368 RepID=A0ABS2A8C8_9ACTN|nr:SRPBCC domain-containing protein [Actinoplanes ovalisporus]MBM2616092.1 SRPBCC domain-containing protein [Actinoplanes ovalisporus]